MSIFDPKDHAPLTRYELLLLAELWLEMAEWSRSSIQAGSDDPHDIAEIGRAAGLEIAARDVLDILGVKDHHIPQLTRQEKGTLKG